MVGPAGTGRAWRPTLRRSLVVTERPYNDVSVWWTRRPRPRAPARTPGGGLGLQPPRHQPGVVVNGDGRPARLPAEGGSCSPASSPLPQQCSCPKTGAAVRTGAAITYRPRPMLEI